MKWPLVGSSSVSRTGVACLDNYLGFGPPLPPRGGLVNWGSYLSQQLTRGLDGGGLWLPWQLSGLLPFSPPTFPMLAAKRETTWSLYNLFATQINKNATKTISKRAQILKQTETKTAQKQKETNFWNVPIYNSPLLSRFWRTILAPHSNLLFNPFSIRINFHLFSRPTGHDVIQILP